MPLIPRHVDVRDEQLRLMLAHQLERLRAVVRDEHGVLVREQLATISASRASSSATRIVPARYSLDAYVAPAICGAWGGRVESRLSRATGAVRIAYDRARRKYTHSEFAPPARAAVRADRAAMRLDQLLDEREPDARCRDSGLAGRRALEPAEQPPPSSSSIPGRYRAPRS